LIPRKTYGTPDPVGYYLIFRFVDLSRYFNFTSYFDLSRYFYLNFRDLCYDTSNFNCLRLRRAGG